MKRPLGLEPFADQSRVEHALVVAGGVLACLVGYVGAAVLLFDLGVLDHGSLAGPRRIATVLASLTCWGYYTVAFVRGKGGPVPDVLAYPAATMAVVPFAFRWIVFGPDWVGLRERFGFVIVRPEFLVDVATFLLPGMALCATLLTLWGSYLGEAELSAWQRRHLSAEFRAAFVEGDGDA